MRRAAGAPREYDGFSERHPMGIDIGRRAAAEFSGTFLPVLGGCGAAVLAAGFPNLDIAFVGVSLAFGLTVLTMA
jgi:aquaporin Z